MSKTKTSIQLHVEKCQEVHGDYFGFFAKCEKLYRRGIRQLRCAECQRYKFPDERCALFVKDKDQGLEPDSSPVSPATTSVTGTD